MDINQLAVEASHDPQAFGSLYDRLHARVYNYVRYRCNDQATTEDLVAQTFEHLLKVIASYQPERGLFEPWLFTIARNVVASHHRAQALRAWLPWEWLQHQPDPGPQPEEAALLREGETALLEALRQLKPQQRDLLGLKYGSGLANPQIAALTGLSEGNVAVILHRAVEALRRVLAPQEAVTSSPGCVKEAEHAGK
jgi:RNA polymerase sigma factor (sigma-70 family)